MNKSKQELYAFEDKTNDEVLLINGFQHINQLIPYINDLQKENQELKQQLQHYRAQEIERINKNLLDTENNYLECCIKANIVGDSNE